MTALLDGRIAIVVGAGSGIGRAIAGRLIAEGARVVVADSGTSEAGMGADPTVAPAVAAALGREAVAFADSVASPGAARQLVDRTVRAFGGLDLLIHAATIRRDVRIGRAEPGDWEAVLHTNLSAAFHLLAAAAPSLAARDGRGRVVFISSSADADYHDGQAATAATDAGLLALMRAAADELAPAGTTVNAVLRPASGDDATPTAGLVAALCTPAARAVSGQVLAVRGDAVEVLDTSSSVRARLDVATPAALADDLATLLARTHP